MNFSKYLIALSVAGASLAACGDDEGGDKQTVVDSGVATGDGSVIPAADSGAPSRDAGASDARVSDSGARDAATTSPVDAATANDAATTNDAAVTNDAGTTGGDAGATPVSTLASCKPCEATQCANVQLYADSYGTDLTKACDKAEGTATTGPGMGMPRKLLCEELVACAQQTGCAAKNLYSCFCGSLSRDECLATTSIFDIEGPCADQYAAAAEATTPAQFFEQAQDARFASGPAYALLECDQKLCSDECYDVCKGQPNGTECLEGSLGTGGGFQCTASGGLERLDGIPPAGKVPGVDCAAPGFCYQQKCGDSPYEAE